MDARSDPLLLALKRAERGKARKASPGKSTTPMAPDWTPEENAILRRMWGEGATASQIAKTINKTRNAVIGKANRIKLEPRASAAFLPKPTPKAKPKPKALAPLPAPKIVADAPPVENSAFAALPTSDPKPLAEATGCLWPIGDSNLFCNAQKGDKDVYCTHHRARASYAAVYRKKAA